MGTAISSPLTLAERTRCHVDRRLMPFVFLLFVISYIDRVNVGFAGLQMTQELGSPITYSVWEAAFSYRLFSFGSTRLDPG